MEKAFTFGNTFSSLLNYSQPHGNMENWKKFSMGKKIFAPARPYVLNIFFQETFILLQIMFC